MLDITAPAPRLTAITALAHRKGDRVDMLLAMAANTLRARGFRIAGAVQHSRPGQSDCCSDFYLEDLSTGTLHEISQRLGRDARGCRFDYGRLAEAHAGIKAGLRSGADALILNRFGYSESQGGGLRPLIERAVSDRLPVLISVNDTYREEWHAFSGEFARDLPANAQAVEGWAHAVMKTRCVGT